MPKNDDLIPGKFYKLDDKSIFSVLYLYKMCNKGDSTQQEKHTNSLQ